MSLATFHPKTTASGFALIEVLVTIVVVSFGLIALAGMGVVGLRGNHLSYMRSIATQQAYDITDRMRANMGDPTNLSVGGVVGGSYNNISGKGTDPACITTGCTYAQLATYDQYAWNTANALLLPSGAGTVKGSATTSFLITITWVGKCAGAGTVAGCASDGTQTQTFQTSFFP